MIFKGHFSNVSLAVDNVMIIAVYIAY